MVLAIAIVVDDAIVVVEGVHAKLDQGYKSAKLASIDAMSELGGAIVSITLVMMSVFIPVSFMGGTAGTFYRQFGLTMAIAIGLSALNALTLSPALCAIFLKPHDEEHKEKKTFFRTMAEKTRYSDAELEEFRAIILEKLEIAKRDYELLRSGVTNSDGNDVADTSPTFKVLEEGASTLSKEEAGRLAQRQMKFIQNLQAALIRIENKTYGICRETGKLIPKERLRAVPHATLSIEAKQGGAK
nr:efflux RND transporter permease subunit [Parabacteroides distasonis]